MVPGTSDAAAEANVFDGSDWSGKNDQHHEYNQKDEGGGKDNQSGCHVQC